MPNSDNEQVMKFTTIIANPPYIGSLHVKFDNFVLKHCLEYGGHFVSISPVGKFTDCSYLKRAKNACDRELIENEKYVRNVELVDAHVANEAFNICAECELGIKHFHKKPNYCGAWTDILIRTRSELLPVYNKVASRLKECGYKNLMEAYDNSVLDTPGIKANVKGKIYVKITGALGCNGQVDKDGKAIYRWPSVIPRDLETTQTDRKPTESRGGFIVFDNEHDRQMTLWRLLAKDCWLMRACSKTVKNDRHVKPEYIPFIPPTDTRSDDEIAIQDFGMTPEEVNIAKKWLEPYISQHDYPKP